MIGKQRGLTYYFPLPMPCEKVILCISIIILSESRGEDHQISLQTNLSGIFTYLCSDHCAPSHSQGLCSQEQTNSTFLRLINVITTKKKTKGKHALLLRVIRLMRQQHYNDGHQGPKDKDNWGEG